MATLKEIKLRIKSVTSISKLTKTMQMVASSKLRLAQRKSELVRQYSQAPKDILSRATGVTKGPHLYIAVTSDKGMCGPINNQVVRTTKALVKDSDEPDQAFIATLGTKGTPAMVNEFPDKFVYTAKDLGKKEFSFVEVGFLVDAILRNADYKQVSVIYNLFKNALTYTPVEIRIPGQQTLMDNLSKYDEFEFEEDEDATFRDLFEFQTACAIWGALFDNKSSELAARMTSMDNATKNANSIISLLTIQYNRGRQAAITTELVEITSGASAIADQ